MGNTREWSDEYVEKSYGLMRVTIWHMSTLTPNEFIRLFPIDKTYDGDKYEMKDYFYTMNYINTLERDEPIGDNIDDFVWEYHNTTIRLFIVARLGLIEEMRVRIGEETMAEEYFSALGVPVYHKMEIEGKPVLFDRKNGRTKTIKRKLAFLKIFRGRMQRSRTKQ